MQVCEQGIQRWLQVDVEKGGVRWCSAVKRAGYAMRTGAGCLVSITREDRYLGPKAMYLARVTGGKPTSANGQK